MHHHNHAHKLLKDRCFRVGLWKCYGGCSRQVGPKFKFNLASNTVLEELFPRLSLESSV